MPTRSLAVVAAVTIGGVAHADAPNQDFFARLAAAARAELAAVVDARPPKLVPPVPVSLSWKPTKLGDIELGAPLVALGGADLDRDGKAELFAVTPNEVVVIAIAGKLKELTRLPFGGTPAIPASRDVVGTIVVDNAEVVAAVSGWTNELRIGFQDAAFVARQGDPAFLVCPQERAALVPGRNYFGTAAAPWLGVKCRRDLVDAEGYPLRVRATLALGGKLAITVERCSPTCQPAGSYELKGVGAAFEIADLDRDGQPELVVSGAGAPGDPDNVKVFTAGRPEAKAMFKQPRAGGVVGITVIDGTGSGVAKVIAAVRLSGSTRIDLWRLD
ncbi:MAG: hypothetical protein AB7O24_13095 [Kofleriaceae bacterium]